MNDELNRISLAHIGSSVWVVTREMLPRLTQARRAQFPPDLQAAVERYAGIAGKPRLARRGAGQRTSGAVAILSLTGVITPRPSFLSMLFGEGGGGLVGFREDFRDAVANPDVGAIIIDVDSPGGLVDLVPETALEIREARGSKPIIAVANTMAASAAYWLATQADELVITPSGTVGSVGVYMLHEDYSGWNERLGIAPTYISAGRYKTEGNIDEPLDEAAQADWQAEVDDIYAMFVDAVAAGRDVTSQEVRDNYGEGRTLLAANALAAGMVDRVEPLESIIGELLAPSSSGPSARAGRLASITHIHAEAADQPRCTCGKWIEAGETQCEDCKAAENEPEPEPDDDEDDEKNNEPNALDPAVRAAHATVLFG